MASLLASVSAMPLKATSSSSERKPALAAGLPAATEVTRTAPEASLSVLMPSQPWAAILAAFSLWAASRAHFSPPANAAAESARSRARARKGTVRFIATSLGRGAASLAIAVHGRSVGPLPRKGPQLAVKPRKGSNLFVNGGWDGRICPRLFTCHEARGAAEAAHSLGRDGGGPRAAAAAARPAVPLAGEARRRLEEGPQGDPQHVPRRGLHRGGVRLPQRRALARSARRRLRPAESRKGGALLQEE